MASSWLDRARSDRQLGTDDRTDPGLPGGAVEPGGAINAVGVQQRQRRIAQRRRTLDQCFGERCAAQEAEGGGGVKFDVSRHVGTSGMRSAEAVKSASTLSRQCLRETTDWN